MMRRLSLPTIWLCITICYGRSSLSNQTNAFLNDSCPRRYRPFPDCNECVEPRLDLSYNCSKCKEAEENCHTGNFTLQVFFHSYKNEEHLCGECREDLEPPVCCDKANETENCPYTCKIRMLLSMEAFESLPQPVHLKPRPPDFATDNVTFFEQGHDVFNFSNISNPHIFQLETWTERFQLYMVLYDFYQVQRLLKVVDRLLININMGPSPASLSRRTYVGIYNISSFDLSFSLNGTVSCDPAHIDGIDGNMYDELENAMCQNEPCDSRNCSKPFLSYLSTDTSTSSNITSSKSRVYGVIAGISAVVLLFFAFICCCCMFFLKRSRRNAKFAKGNTEDASSTTENDDYETIPCNIKQDEVVVRDDDQYDYIVGGASAYIKSGDDNEYVYVI